MDVLGQHGRRRLGAPARQARISVGGIADERQVVGNRLGAHAELLDRPPASSLIVRVRRIICTTRVPRTHCARSLSGVQISDAIDLAALRRDRARRRERVVGLELDHRPHGDAERGERFFEQRKLRPQVRLDAVAGLVPGPEPVPERLDDVIGRHAHVRGAAVDHREDGREHAAHRADFAAVGIARATGPRSSGGTARRFRR